MLLQNDDKLSIKIADFNLSKEINSPTNSDKGSLWYQSPEIINSEAHSFKTDVWYKLFFSSTSSSIDRALVFTDNS